jgi:CheY-like chemotaxis protein
MESGYLLADPTQFHQLCMNLCINAFQAMDESGGTLTVSISKKEHLKDDLPHTTDLLPGPFIQLIVRDIGPGIPASVQNKMFDPYFTTKKIGEGTGMGLAIVHGIVKSYGAYITCKSQPGKGTIFNINLPAITQYKEKRDIAGDDASPRGSERLLFVDDEEMLGKMAKTILERLGYDVSIKSCPMEALEFFEKQPEMFDMLITDLSMPGMDGIELTKKMLAIRSDLPVMLCTGNSGIISKDEMRATGINKIACKPFSKKEFAIFVREVLDHDNRQGE